MNYLSEGDQQRSRARGNCFFRSAAAIGGVNRKGIGCRHDGDGTCKGD